ncbi:response regulator [Niveispirillum sp. SYP-B3756]|uniref:ATP-binding protein n=1 Tax=Niveispirillum sp. SYP-B3756 TaxID=2662178 RepID=UPI0012923931|nr:ATP-binding protein [Niveispirillum sp. SYP-B3756]MQP66794.1 response regulator [Niveispirillum sp. SYP-B3756]
MELLKQLHVPTLMVVFIVTSLSLTFVMAVYWWRQRAIPGLGYWTLSSIVGCLGFSFLIARGYIPLWLSVSLGNLLVGFALVLVLVGIRRFSGRPPGWATPLWTLFMLVGVLVYDVLTRDDLVLRSILASIWVGGINGANAWESWRSGHRTRQQLWILPTAIFGIMTLVMVARLLDLVLSPRQVFYFSPSPSNGLNLLLSTVGANLCCLAMMGVTNEWLQRRLQLQVSASARYARQRDQAAQRAEAASRSKSVFLATVSHEIRTPINAMMGGLEIMNGAGGDRLATRRALSVMEKAGQSMLSLLEDLLDLSRMEAGHLSLASEPVDLHQRLYDAVELMAGRAAANGLSLDIAIAPDVPRYVSTDPARLRQILLNLIGNAVKFTEVGGIHVAVTRRPLQMGDKAGTNGVPLRITVADTGIGIASEKLAHVFEPFYQAEAGDSRRHGGVGLGLSICHKLIRMMGGNISVDSSLGHGTVFTVDLPMPLALMPQQGNATVRSLPCWNRRPQVMLVEDDEVNRFVAQQLLNRHGVEVIQAPDGETALALLREKAVSTVLMDIGMPGLDGFETTARLRASGGPMAHVPVIALTANVLPETVARSRIVGMQGFIAKPIRLEELLAALAAVMPPDGLGRVETPDPASAPPPSALSTLRDRLGDGATSQLLQLAGEQMALARRSLAFDATPAPAELRRIALRLADALDAVEQTTDAQALRDCLGLLLDGQPPGTAQAAMDAILAGAQARLPRPHQSAA